MRRVFSASSPALAAAMPVALIRHDAGYARIAPTHSDSASAPLHASVTSMGTEEGPNNATAAADCSRVAGHRICVATHGRRNSPNSASDHPPRRSANLRAADAASSVARSTRNLLDRYLRGTERAAQRRDRVDTPQPWRARKDVDVHHAGLRPGVQHRV